MKRVHLERWGTQFLSPRILDRPHNARTRIICQSFTRHAQSLRWASTEAPVSLTTTPSVSVDRSLPVPSTKMTQPILERVASSAKLAALHARLSLPNRLPLETLARTLVDPTANRKSAHNNSALSILGADLLGYYTSEYFLCHYPRLPMSVLWSAQWAYVGPKALSTIANEWGVEAAVAPEQDVDAGLLQFKRVPPGALQGSKEKSAHLRGTGRPNEDYPNWRRGVTSRIVYDDQFGELKYNHRERDGQATEHGVTHETACFNFVRAVMGAIYLHAGRIAAKRFFNAHFMTRQLDMGTLFDFKEPARDLSVLCDREGFERPVARLISETGRYSRHPVFVVGVFSGIDKLGEAPGASLDEARFKAAAAALKSWYLYRPLEVTIPSDAEGEENSKPFLPNLIDCGEVIVPG